MMMVKGDFILEHKDKLINLCNLIFSITEFDIGLFDQSLNSLCFLTRRAYPDSIWTAFSAFEPELLLHLENTSKSSYFWQTISDLELMYLNIRIQISEKEYYYAVVGPTLLLSYSDILIKNILKKAKLSLSQKEDYIALYQSLPFFHSKTKNLFLVCYHLLTTITTVDFPPIISEYSPEPSNSYQPILSNNALYTKSDIQWNCEKELLWRQAISRGDFANAKKEFQEMTSMDYLYCTPDDSLQTRKHILFSINTLCRAAATDGGADSIMAQQVHNTFFLLIKTLSNSTQTDTLIQQILEKYCNLVISSHNKDFSPIVRKAVNYIHAHYDQPVTLHMTAEAISCGESHLSRCFHKETGQTFKAFLNEFRIKQAISLLETGFYPITDIALLVGFSSYTKFSVAFKKIMGMCASDYLELSEKR